MLRTREVAKLLSTSVQSVINLIRSGKLEGVWEGNRVLIPEESVDRFLQEYGKDWKMIDRQRKKRKHMIENILSKQDLLDDDQLYSCSDLCRILGNDIKVMFYQAIRKGWLPHKITLDKEKYRVSGRDFKLFIENLYRKLSTG